MAITDHVAILLGHSLDVPRLNKKKTRSDYYAQVALPPAAIGDLAELVGSIYPGVPLSTLEVNILPNAQQARPFPGVPSDWYIIRLASTFAPELYGADGSQFPAQEARSRFFAGMRVRIHTSAWPWKNEFGKSGASFNLHGVMDAGQGGERLAIGGGANQAGAAFKQFADPTKTPAPAAAGNVFAGQHAPAGQYAGAGAGTAANVTGSAAAAGGNPFAAGGNPGAVGTNAPAANANPFAQAASGAASGNPFM